MKLHIVCVGKLREKHFAAAAEDYITRLQRFYPTQIIEVAALPEGANASDADREKIREQEGEKLLARISEQWYVVAMAIDGKQMDSESFADFIEGRKMYGRDIAFVIGGSLGLSQRLLQRSDMRLSMSEMTFPHQLARIMLLEQLYRASMISAGQTYHK